jgi:SprT-like family
VIAWLTRKFSRDPGQLGLFEAAADWRDELLRTKPEIDHTRDSAVAQSVETVAEATDSECDIDESPAARTSHARVEPEAFLRALQSHGLRGVTTLVFTRNRRTMVSLASGVLRVHEGFVSAPSHVHTAIATFATSRNRAKRSAARDIIVAHPVPIRPAARRPAAQHADDMPMAVRLTTLHRQLNLLHFDNALSPLDVQVSRRLARRLGHYTPRSMTGREGEIVLSQRHIRRDGWAEATHTLLHEMVHQWQDETGRPIDHGAGFRAKCRSVGIEPAATRLIHR